MDTETTDGYLRLEDAAILAKVNPKTIRNWAEARKIGRKKVKGIVWYNQADLEEQGAKAAETKLIQANPYGGPVLPQIAATVASAMAAAPGPRLLNMPEEETRITRKPLPIDRKIWLTLDEAAEYTGVAKKHLREHAEGERIGPNGSIVYRRRKLEELW